MKASVIPYLIALLLAPCAQANEALDVLEGRKKASEINLPPPPEGSPAAHEAVKTIPLEFIDPGWGASPLDPVWSRATLFNDEENPWLQQLAITGFFDWRITSGDAEVNVPPDSDLDGSRTRRARLGARLRAFRNTDIEASYEMAGSGANSGIDRLSARTSVRPNTHITYGKFQPNLGIESTIRPESSPFPERSALTNMVVPATTLGFRMDRRSGPWDYAVGWFTGDEPDDLPDIKGDGFLTLNLGHTTLSAVGDAIQRTRWHLDYLHNFDASRNMAGYDIAGRRSANGGQLVSRNPAFRHLLSTGFTIEHDRFSFLGDIMIAKGDTTVWGLTMGPTWWAVPGTLKIVGRYQYAGSDDPSSIVTGMGSTSDLRFDNAPFFVGDEYQSFYLGANLHLYQNRLLLHTGVENIIFSDENGAGFDTDAWLWQSGARLSF